ncbi:uncharacterized protein LOC107266585 [Cephus cinctus]|uniref:Uncharacterized protein LOC107266585 n=1 Tax=Cephus cinctus TaxID=211228 RepID=A0AAJ7RFH3_CEPCN|nr:uncharacterized protein LOC107266585 [Cephus cinctus]
MLANSLALLGRRRKNPLQWNFLTGYQESTVNSEQRVIYGDKVLLTTLTIGLPAGRLKLKRRSSSARANTHKFLRQTKQPQRCLSRCLLTGYHVDLTDGCTWCKGK